MDRLVMPVTVLPPRLSSSADVTSSGVYNSARLSLWTTTSMGRSVFPGSGLGDSDAEEAVDLATGRRTDTSNTLEAFPSSESMGVTTPYR